MGHRVMEILYPQNTSAWCANPELGYLGMFLFWSCFYCVCGGMVSGREVGIRKNNKAKLNPGIKMEPRYL